MLIHTSVIACPHFCGHKDFFSGDKSFVNRTMDTSANTGFIAINTSSVDQPIAVPQRPINRFLCFGIGQGKGSDTKDRHGNAIVQRDGSSVQIKFRVKGNKFCGGRAKDVEPNTVVGGNPARVLKYLDAPVNRQKG